MLTAGALRYDGIYGVYGISVFAVRDATLEELAHQVPLVRFERLTLLTVGDVIAAGPQLEPTGWNPRHYTASFGDLDDGVRGWKSWCGRKAQDHWQESEEGGTRRVRRGQ